ncbi:sodium:alanine symporter family protein [Oscillibacter sp.]|uniref:alanine/glycine:cation symporter family protein n=1 Tax=Oscillibacter sp. TaxID=1945593 RepID=UPI0026255FD9|nr:sodium:alanine symporter family protein [Oscillibacter sp.]MDD3347702.1 sodium:alanine symporter family protein [Oscillibacter sp.]
MAFSNWISTIDTFLWGPGTLALLMGTGIFLTVRTRFLPWRNLGYALRTALGREARRVKGLGDVSPFSALMTALAATIGTGNIVGVATALTAGGPGALVWMELSALFGMSTKFAECLLAVRFRRVNARGELSGGPMYVMRDGLRSRSVGRLLGGAFALFAVCASFGIGSMTQANSIAGAMHVSFGVPTEVCGPLVAGLALLIILGGIRSISSVSAAVVPAMALFYLASGTAVILGNLDQLPAALCTIFRCAFSPRAAVGGVAGTAARSMLDAARWGVARGVFSNEAGLGSAAISAASAATNSPPRQGYINMTGTFFDTIIICTVTGLAICCSGVLGLPDSTGGAVDGASLTILAFQTVLGPLNGIFVSIAIVLFAFSTILGWEYQGEKAFEYLFGTRPLLAYRVAFALAALWGAGQHVELVFRLSDIANALMCIPNLASLLLLSPIVVQETLAFQPSIRKKR